MSCLFLPPSVSQFLQTGYFVVATLSSVLEALGVRAVNTALSKPLAWIFGAILVPLTTCVVVCAP